MVDLSEKELELQYKHIDKATAARYVEYFREGKAVVPIKKVATPFQNQRFSQKGESKEVDLSELYNYYRADGVVQTAYGSASDMIIAYGFRFDLQKPLLQDFSEVENNKLHLMEVWRSFVQLDEFVKYIELSVKIFGDFFCEKIYDERSGGRLSQGGWGIKRLKILDPRTIFVDRNDDGTVKMFYQHPRADQMQPRSIKRSTRSIKIPPPQMIHIKRDDFMNKTYGIPQLYASLDTIDQKLGVKADAVAIAQRRASPFLVWSVGSDDRIYPTELLDEIRIDLENQLFDTTDHDVFVPGFIHVQEVGGDSSASTDLIMLIDFLNKEIAIAAGIPDILLAGGSASGEAAEMKTEMYVRHTRSRQIIIGEQLRKQLFFDLFFPPKVETADNNRKKVTSQIGEATPLMWQSVPLLRFNMIESVADHRLRLGEMADKGLIKESEGREQLGARGKIKDEEYPVSVRTDMKKAEQKPPSAGNPTKAPSKTKASSLNK
jgi:hypothetical protein